MALILAPRQRAGDRRWEQTEASDEALTLVPVGYCRAFGDAWPEGLRLDAPAELREMYRRDRTRALPFEAHYHVDGHATPEEAAACYRRFVLDQRLRIWTAPDAQRKCQICEQWTQGRVTADDRYVFHLCPEHNSRAHVQLVFEAQDRARRR